MTRLRHADSWSPQSPRLAADADLRGSHQLHILSRNPLDGDEALMSSKPVVTSEERRRFRISRRVVLILAVMLLSACGGRYGRFNPTVAVDVRHPPGVGLLVQEVVFAPPDPSAAPPDRSFLAQLEGVFTRSEWLDPGGCTAEIGAGADTGVHRRRSPGRELRQPRERGRDDRDQRDPLCRRTGPGSHHEGSG